MSLKGKTALVTGAGGGLGREIVASFLADGAEVVAVDLDPERLEQLGSHSSLKTVVADVTSPTDVDRAVTAGGQIDVLCNNAGILDRLGGIDEVTLEEWDRLVAVNLGGPFLLCHRVVPDMLARGYGTIINIASVSGLRGARAGVAYTASKFGVVGLTYNIAASLGGRGIRCNAICPGGMQTGMGAGREMAPNWPALKARDNGKPASATPAEVTQVALFLARDESAQINGVALPVDGGWIAY